MAKWRFCYIGLVKESRRFLLIKGDRRNRQLPSWDIGKSIKALCPIVHPQLQAEGMNLFYDKFINLSHCLLSFFPDVKVELGKVGIVNQ
jgi:hypothetical protein